jgi:hypothetical protein
MPGQSTPNAYKLRNSGLTLPTSVMRLLEKLAAWVHLSERLECPGTRPLAEGGARVEDPIHGGAIRGGGSCATEVGPVRSPPAEAGGSARNSCGGVGFRKPYHGFLQGAVQCR